jgi:3-hydroxyacyl-CoA dehydrogenase / enoyl-CoA hydratase / 3-hydroxybutyryl-CoA epimerase
MTTDLAGQHWTLRLDGDGIAWLTLDRQGASTNTLSTGVLRELATHLATLKAKPPRGLVVASAKANGFIAGADITEFRTDLTLDEGLAMIRAGQQTLDALEALPCPTVAALHGFALGGGLELALACRYRVAAAEGTTSLGLPEVNLGIHPGYGGTVRAPRLIGVRAAMQLMLTGAPVRADKALRMGLVDRVVPQAGLLDAAKALVQSPPARRKAPLLDRLLGWPVVRGVLAGQLDQQVARRARREHYPAPYAIVDLWRQHGGSGAAAYRAEAQSIATLFGSATSRNLVRVYFLQERLKAMGGKGQREFRHVHVVGAGVMGGDIAAWCAWRGMTVTLQDREAKYVEPAMARARELFTKKARGQAARADEATARLTMDIEGAGVPRADVVIEAIYENPEAKRALYARLVPQMKPEALLCTNTSSLVLEDLARELPDPSRLVGLHFFNPVAKMPLVEVIHGRATDPAVAQAALAFTRRLDKLPLPCGSAPGFVVNRVLMPYIGEAMLAAQEGVALATIDRVAVEHGFPMGPIELADTVGLDIAMHVGKVLAEAFGKPTASNVVALVEARKLGRKSGEGFYPWVDGKPRKPPEAGPAPEDLEDRLVLSYVNEAVACLRDGVVTEADLLDVGMIFGTGYAPFRGGPLAYARTRGVDACVARLRELAARHGARFAPDAGWEALRPPGA